MSHSFMPLAKELALALADGSGSAPTGTLKMALLRLDGTLSGSYASPVTGATAATPIVLTTALAAASVVGDKIVTLGVGGTLGANGTYRCSARDATHITLQTLNGVNTIGVGAYTSGGCAINLTKAQYYSHLSACVVGTPVALSSVTFTKGVLGSGVVTHANVPAGVVSAYIIYLDTGVAATSPIIYFSDAKQRIACAANAAGSATSIITTGLEGALSSADVLTWSNGIQSTLSGAAAAGMDGVTLAVNALSAGIAAGHSCDAGWANSLFPLTLGATGTITITPDAGGNYTGEPVGFGEI
jgi:hypothetical protein